MTLTDDEIKAIDPDGLAEGFARAIESAVLEKLKALEPVFFADKDAVMSIKHAADTFDVAIGVRNTLERDGDVPLYLHPDPSVAKFNEMKVYIDDVCTILCGPYRWCDNTTVLRKIEQLLVDGNKLLGNK